MIDIKNKAQCIGCGACAQVCPKKCIIMEPDEEGFLYPRVDHSKCVECKKCESVCPTADIANDIPEHNVIVFGIKNKDNNVRYHSSSGGVFSSLAEHIILHEGMVFGASMVNNNKSVCHVGVSDVSDLYKLQGSKYVQSSIGSCFVEAKQYLETGKSVLFTGTPCQIKGLKTFLKRDYDNLICVEVICHGVPSQTLWEKYIEYVERTMNGSVIDVSFRSKKYGWSQFGMRYKSGKNKQRFKFHFEDPFFRMFCDNICLRPSCYECSSKDGRSGADISLGDFWNIEKVDSGFNDNKGISMVLIHTVKGKRLLEEIQSSLIFMPSSVEYDLAKLCNPAIAHSPKRPTQREMFYVDMNTLKFDQLVCKYAPNTFKIRVKSILMKTGVWNMIDKIRGDKS